MRHDALYTETLRETGTGSRNFQYIADYAHAADLDAFNKQVQALAGEALPRRNGAAAFSGKYCYALSQEPTALATGANDDLWDNIVGQLAGRPAYTDLEVFLRVIGWHQDHDKRVRVLTEGASYDLLVYHYHPDTNRPRKPVTLQLRYPDTAVVPVSSPEIPIESPYDLKRFTVQIRDVTVRNTWISLHCSDLRIDLQLDLRTNAVDRFTRFFLMSAGILAAGAAPVIAGDATCRQSALAIGVVALGALAASYAAIRPRSPS